MKVICNYCNAVTDIRISKDSFYCNNCNVEIIITKDDVRQYYDLQVPQQEPTNETNISSIPIGYGQWDNVKIKKEPKFEGSFKVLRDKGMHITNYYEYLPE
jgi:hypothetical protein